MQGDYIYRIRNKTTGELERVSIGNPLNMYSSYANARMSITEVLWDDEVTREWAKKNLEIVKYQMYEVGKFPYTGKSQGKKHTASLRESRRMKKRDDQK